MSVKRTPPPRTSPSVQSLTHCKSDSNINESPLPYACLPLASSEFTSSEPNIGRKRKHSGELSRSTILEMFDLLQKQQEERFAALMTKVQGGIECHTEQNKNISASIDFLAQKYDEMAIRITSLEQEKTASSRYIQTLESQLEQMERHLRSSSIEVRNVPKKADESKEDLLNIVKNIGNALSVPLQQSDIRDAYRINNKRENNQCIIAELMTVGLRDKIIGSVKAYNKKYATTKFSTNTIKMGGITTPIFISESLTIKTKKLFYFTREFAKTNDYKYCWTSHGKVYLREKDGVPLTKINTDEDLEKLKNK